MTDWFVDSAAAGDGSGTSPANAVTNVGSHMRTGSLFAGDRTWISKKYFEDIGDGTTNPVFGASENETNDRDKYHFIGWPSAGDPFYNQRPQAGIDAGWDSHAQATANIFAEEYPTWVGSFAESATRGLRILDVNRYYNMIFCNSGANLKNIFDSGDHPASPQGVWFDNIFFAQPAGINFHLPAAGKITIHGETADTLLRGTGGTRINQLNVASESFAAHVFDHIDRNVIDSLIIHTNSLESIADANAEDVRPFMDEIVIGSIYGLKHWGPIVSSDNLENTTQITIDDYYGEGPHRAATTRGQWRSRPNSGSVEIEFDSGKCQIVTADPQAAANSDFAVYGNVRFPVSGFRFNVDSGSKYSVDWPVYTSVWSLIPADGCPFALRQNRGGKIDLDTTYIGTLSLNPGSGGNWSGSLDAGSAWLLTTSFEAKFTGVCGFIIQTEWYSTVRSTNSNDERWSHSGWLAFSNTPGLSS